MAFRRSWVRDPSSPPHLKVKEYFMPKQTFDDFTTQIQSDEIASRGGYPGGDWINDFDENERDDEFDD